MSASWSDLTPTPAEPCHCPVCQPDDFSTWERQLVEPDREREPWWVFADLDTFTALLLCGLPFLALVVAVLSAGGAH